MYRIIAMLLLIAGVAHAGTPKPWLYLPGKPTAATISFAKKQTADRYVIKQSADVVYLVGIIRLGHPKDFDANVQLDKAVEMAISTVSAEAVGSARKLTVENAPAREVIAKLTNDAIVTMRFVIADDMMYVLYVGGAAAFDANGAVITGHGGDAPLGGGMNTLDGRRDVPSTPKSTSSLGQPTTTGGQLDHAIIRRYVKRNLDKLQLCYEKELAKNPKLVGTVTVEFVITANGSVSSSKASGIDPKVSDCIAAAIHQIEFPKPRDDKDINVTYPLTFRPLAKK